jgi:hypothetical protein
MAGVSGDRLHYRRGPAWKLLPRKTLNMNGLIVDQRYVLEEECEGIELRLAVKPDESALYVVGTKGGMLAFFDELNPTKLRMLGAGARMLALLAIAKEDPRGMLGRLRDTEYARLVSPDPTRLGHVQVSGPLSTFQIVDCESL